MGFRKQHIAFTGLLMVLSTTSFAQDSRARIVEIQRQKAEQVSTISQYRADLNDKTVEIERIKKGSGIVSNLVLQKKMREAQTVSKDLENLVKAHAQLSQDLRKERSKLFREIDQELQTLTANKKSRKLADLQQIQRLISEKDSLLALQQNELLDIPNFNLSSAANDREDLIEKLQVVEDLQKNISNKITFLKEELSEDRSKEFLRSELTHFIDEENFFGEQSFISNGLNRGNNAKNPAALALKKDSTSDTSVPTTTPTTSPTPASTTASTTAEVTVVTPQTSTSTSFQQPQELGMFKTLLDQIQESIRDTNPKQAGRTKSDSMSIAKAENKSRKKLSPIEQNLEISEQILNDLNILHQNLNQKLQEIE